MKLTPRLFAGLAAFTLVLAGVTAIAPSSARAEEDQTAETFLAVGIFAAVTVAAFALIDEDGDDDEAPQSP
jgi:heme/copper-type cytochrome/quinol oxidase subunit 1